ncbi:MAG: hypothetical protein ACREXY_20855, partial [Gammaproteobacteria bacterium]
AGPMLVYFDRFAIGALLGGAAVAFYVIGFNIIMQMLLVPTAFSRALFPHFASMEIAESAKQGAEASRLLLIVAMLMTLVAMALISPFLHVWLGADIAAQSTPVTIILLIGFWANSAAQSAFTHLQSKGRADLPAKAHLLELLPYFALFYLLTVKFGIVGAATAWTARAVSDFIILQVIDGLDRSLRRLIAATLAFVVLATAVQFLVNGPWLRFVSGLVVVAAASIFARTVAPPSATEQLSAIFARLRPARELQ